MRRIPMRSDTDATRVADCFILDFPCLCEASGSTDDASSWRLDGDLRQKNIGTPLVAAVNPGPPGCVSAAIGARNWLRARTTASPIRRMGTWWRMAGGSLADLLAVAAEEQKNGDEAGGSHVVASSRDARDGRQSKIEFLSRRNRRRRSPHFVSLLGPVISAPMNRLSIPTAGCAIGKPKTFVLSSADFTMYIVAVSKRRKTGPILLPATGTGKSVR